MNSTMTIRLEDSLKDRLEKLSEAMQRSKSFLAAEAIKDFVELNEWQVDEIKLAVKEANSEEFASDQEVQGLFDRWGLENGD
ncbi:MULTISPECIES: CopG family ribbon-helix-helix protein [unclassified Endozoicomonas]